MDTKVVQGTTRRGFLKDLGLALGSAAIGGTALLLKPKSVEAAGWHSYGQSYRNSLILNRAWNDYGRYFNQLSCKEWVRKVIYNVSGGEMMIPSNQDNCRWLWSQYVSGYNISRDIRYAQPGEIVQMQLRNAPYLHTAIVSSMMADRVGFIDQNWISPGWTVGYHEILFSTFYSGSSITCYSIYTIL